MRKLVLFSVAVAIWCASLAAQAGLLVVDIAGWNSGRLPSNWQIKVNRGKPDIAVSSDAGGPCLRLKSVSASFALERSVDVDPGQMPYLAWRWKVAQLPPGGDFRRSATDDQAAQVLVAYADRRIVSYIWDSNAPQGMVQNASAIPLVHIFAVVCQSGAVNVNRWIAENHNVAADYQRVYNRPAPRVKGIRLQINSQHTGAVAESYFGQVAFRSSPD